MPKDIFAKFQKGATISGGLFPEKAELISVERSESLCTIYAKGTETGKIYERILTKNQAEEINIARKKEDLSFSASPEDFFLGVEAQRIRLAFEFDPLFAVNVSRIDPVPHQLEAVYKYILPKRTVKYLLADDPGAGKTIMAGLILKELKMRGLVNNCLIAVPGHLKYQWLREMKEKFSQKFTLIDRGLINASYGTDVWKDRRWCITSVDFAKQDDIKETLKNTKWDLAIVDEAHKLSAYQYGDKTKKTKRYQLGEVLSDNSENMLFLTATPHKGDPDNFRLLLSLLDSDVFSSNKRMEQVLEENKEEYILRRMKEELTDFEGKKLFPPRDVTTIGYELSRQEMELYNEVTKYVEKYYKRAQKIKEDRKKRNITLALIVLQRRAASSVRALRKSLENRREKLQNQLDSHQLVQEMEGIYGDLEDMPEEERWKVENALESLTTARDFEELQDEINELNRLIAKAKKVERAGEETKLSKLKGLVEEHIDKNNIEDKLLIFTEARATLKYLTEKLKAWGYSVTSIHGNMSLEERIKAEEEFKHSKQILVGTEAAGEGVNLQFCWMMVNYDIPWNPNKLEQRMGRIHRYGQKHPIVFIFNMVALNTREGKVLNKLFKKVEIMKEHLGEEKVYDVIGDILENANAEELIQKVMLGEKEVEDAEEEIDSVSAEQTQKEIEKLIGEALAIKVDVPWGSQKFKVSEENKLVPEYLQNFFIRAFENIAGKGKIRHRKDGFLGIDWVPAEIKDVPYEFRMKYGVVDDRYPKFTFDKSMLEEEETADYIAPGHPLMEAVIHKVLDRYKSHLSDGTVFEDPDGQMNGLIWILEGKITDGLGKHVGKRMFSVYLSKNGDVKLVNPSILWDLKAASKPIDNEIKSLLSKKRKVLEKVISGPLTDYKNSLKEESKREVEIKRKYSLKSLEERIEKLDIKMLDYLEKGGNESDAPYRNWETDMDKLQYKKQNLEEELEKQLSLTLTPPKVIGVAAVVPATGESKISQDPQIEKIGMKVAMKYEKEQGRNPIDVSEDNRGYDVLSENAEATRYIEVKARAREGRLILTPNEWMTAKQLKDKYWLYVITNAAKNPKLHIIQDPTNKLSPTREVKIVRYVVGKEDWKKVVS